MRYFLAALLMLTLFASAFAQDGTSAPDATVEQQIVTIVPSEVAPIATLEATPVAGTVCEDGANCTINDTPLTSVDPLTGLLFMASGSLLTLVIGGLTLYIAGARILRGVMSSSYAMTFFEFLYNQGKARTSAALQKEAADATRTYEEFREKVTDGIPELAKPPRTEIPTIPRTPPSNE